MPGQWETAWLARQRPRAGHDQQQMLKLLKCRRQITEGRVRATQGSPAERQLQSPANSETPQRGQGGPEGFSGMLALGLGRLEVCLL